MKLTLPFLFFLLVGILPSCKQGSSSSLERLGSNRSEEVADFDLAQIKDRGYLIAIMENSSTGLFVYKGKTMGYEYELIKLFCDHQGIDLRIELVQNLEQAFQKLNRGEGDVLAYNLTVTKDRKDRISFTDYLNLQKQVLIQRKPAEWRKMKLHEIEKQLIRNPIDLIGKEVTVRPHSSYSERLANLSDEIGGDILIIPGPKNSETEQLIKMVAEGAVDYTVAEEDLALVNASYYPILDVKTAVSFPTQIAWGVRKNSKSLFEELNSWILSMRKEVDFYVIYDKYFKSKKSSRRRTKSKYFSVSGGDISPYDSLLKESAKRLGWDWHLLAAQVFRESKFDPNAKSWAGAVGLLQVMPITGKEYGITNLTNPQSNIEAGTQHLLWLKKQWAEKIVDEEEQIKFVLASYNVGLGHLQDAVRLTEKFGKDPTSWEDVSEFLLKKSSKAYFNDPVVKYGYCRGAEPVEYVRHILNVYGNYSDIFTSNELEEPQ